MVRNILLSIHLLSIIAWIGAGFFQLYLGRKFMEATGSAVEAPLIRIVQRSDTVVVAATMLAFAAGIALTITEGYGFFSVWWLGLKQAIMLVVLGVVAFIVPTAMKFNKAVGALPIGPGPANDDVRRLYRKMEPWTWTMRVLAVCAVLLAVWRPG